MTNYRIWLIAALVIGGFVYFWADDEEAAKESSTNINSQPKSVGTQAPSQSEYQYQRDASTPAIGSRYNGHRSQSGATEPGYPLYSGQPSYRFRPHENEYANDTMADPSHLQPWIKQEYMPPSPSQMYQPQHGLGFGQMPEQTLRFRPLDEKDKAKRWTGNYDQMKRRQPHNSPGRYEFDPYINPGQLPQAPSQPHPLWADSWPER